MDIINQVVSGTVWPAFRHAFDVILSTSEVSQDYLHLGVSSSTGLFCLTLF
jgi:hypothetical protein